MNRIKLPIRERIGNVAQFPIGVDVAVAEYRVVDYLLRLGVIKGNGTRDNPDPRPRIWGCYRNERPNAGPDDVDIEDVTVEDVILEGIVAEEDPVEDPEKNEYRTTDELMTMVRSTTRGRIGRSLPEKELNIRQRRRLELIKNYDWEILYHSGKANMVADALSKKERLKMIMSFGEFIRDFEKMEIEVKVTGAGTEKLFEIAIQTELLEKNILCQKK
ncbi:hypothetical protein AgCh_012469 [Apium graveolens]